MKQHKESRSRRVSRVKDANPESRDRQGDRMALPPLVHPGPKPKPHPSISPRRTPSDVETWVGSLPRNSLSPASCNASLDLARRASETRRLSLLPPEIVIHGEGGRVVLEDEGGRGTASEGERDERTSTYDDGEKAAENETNSERGSDYYSDDDFESDSEEEVAPRNLNMEADSVYAYHRMCRHLGILPLRTVIAQFGRPTLTFKDLTLSSRDIKATCTALLHERYAWSVDLSGNEIRSKEVEYVISVVCKRPNFTTLILSNNNLSGRGIRVLSAYLRKTQILKELDISGNKLNDSDCSAVQEFLVENRSVVDFAMNHNEVREAGGKLLGFGIGRNGSLERLDLSWNHLRRAGAIGVCRGLEANKRLTRVSVAWNGFGYEGSVAMADVLAKNKTLKELDISSNRINPSAMMELIRGLARNKTLTTLRMGHNPITAAFSSVLISAVFRNPHMALQTLDLEGIVVDTDFEGIVSDIKKTRFFRVNFEASLPIRKVPIDNLSREIELPYTYNVDPIRMLYLLKEKYRAQDFFWKINKDNNDSLDRDELAALFKEAGIPVTKMVIDKIMDFMDTDGDGTIDMAEFLQGDRRMKKMARHQLKTAQKMSKRQENYAKNSRPFQSAQIDSQTLTLKVQRSSPQLQPLPDAEEEEESALLPRLSSMREDQERMEAVPTTRRSSRGSVRGHSEPTRSRRPSLLPPQDLPETCRTSVSGRSSLAESQDSSPSKRGSYDGRKEGFRRPSDAKRRASMAPKHQDSSPRRHRSRESRRQPPALLPR